MRAFGKHILVKPQGEGCGEVVSVDHIAVTSIVKRGDVIQFDPGPCIRHGDLLAVPAAAVFAVEDLPESDAVLVYDGDPWHADECNSCVRFHRGHLQVFKAPKEGTPYSEYWPRPGMIRWMLDALNQAEKTSSPPEE